MDRPAPSHRRRIHYIKKDFQFRFIIKFCLLVLLGAVVSSLLLSLLAQGTLTSTFSNSRLVIQKTSAAILPAMIYTNLITLALIGLATIFVTLYASHKLAGPMFRFEEDLKIIGQGDLTKEVRLREKDQLRDLVESLNKMTSSLRGKVIDIRDQVAHLSVSARDRQVPVELMREIQQIEQMIATRFRLDADSANR